jgi:class III poly(R)-hydroxyalkanoic acid synthase PhaE subunit
MKEQMSQGAVAWLNPEVAAAATSDLPELWKLFGAQMRDMGAPWLQSLQETRGHLGDAMSGDRRAFIKTSNLFMDTFEGTLGKFAAAPAMGYSREFQEKVTKAFETWVEVRKAEVEFYTESVNIGFRALEALLRELVQKGERGEKITSFRELFDVWVSTADKSFFEAASSEGFAEVQGRMVNAGMHYRIHEREVVEVFLKALHLPTRQELDDAYRHMYEMRKEVKALRKELAQLRREMTQAEGNPRNAPEPRAIAPAQKTAKASASRTASATRGAKNKPQKKEG